MARARSTVPYLRCGQSCRRLHGGESARCPPNLPTASTPRSKRANLEQARELVQRRSRARGRRVCALGDTRCLSTGAGSATGRKDRRALTPMCKQVDQDRRVGAKNLLWKDRELKRLLKEAGEKQRTAPLAPTDGWPTSAKLAPRTKPKMPAGNDKV